MSVANLPSSVWAKRLLAAAAVLVLLAGVVGYDMWRLYQQELLWGYRPLWFLLAAWGGIVLFRQSRKAGRVDQWDSRPLLWSSLSGILLGIGFPDIVPLPLLLLVAWVPLLRLEADWRERADNRKRTLLPYLFNAFVLWNIVATYWVTNTSFAAGLFANFANSLLMCIPWILFLLTRPHLPKLGYATLIAFWLTFEYIHLQWDLTWPWLNLGNGWAEYPSLIQWYEYTGTFGGSLWIWVINILVFENIYGKKATLQAPIWRKWLQVGLITLLPMIASIIMYSSHEEVGPTAEVVVVQPNFEPHYEKFERVSESDQITRFIELSLPLLDENTDYLVFPETSYGWVEEESVLTSRYTERLRNAFAAYPQLNLITGLNAYHDFGADEPRTSATRTRERAGRTIDFEVMNLAAQIPMDNTTVPQTYRKSKLVPGPESFPFKSILFFMEPVVDALGGTAAGLGVQEKRSAFTNSSGTVAPVICYESVFGEYFGGYIRDGKAETAFIMTNDGWWDNTAGHRQHLYYASLRAIETRRSIARSANTGISCFVNQRGDLSQLTSYDEPIAIKGEVHLNQEITFYVRWGDIIARIAMFLSIISLLNAFVKARIKKGEEKSQTVTK